MSLANNQESEGQSGASRLCNSIIVAICLAPLLLIVAVFVVGWNEKRDVCAQNAILEGKKAVAEVPCTATSGQNSGDLIMFACDIDRAGLQRFSLPGTDFASADYQGTGLETVGQMLQCVEKSESDTHKTSGGGSETTTTYTYTTKWVGHRVDSSAFKRKEDPLGGWYTKCGVENPLWPEGLPQTRTAYAPQARVGPFTIPKSYVQKVPLDTAVNVGDTPIGWTSAAVGTYSTSKWQVSGGPGGHHGIGQAKVAFKGNNWNDPTVTVLGLNSAGNIGPWEASATWLCSGSMLSDLRTGHISKQDLFAAMASSASSLTWVLRIIGFLVMWGACSRFAAPLGVAADCIPCVGPWIGDKVEAVACCITCFPACGCCLGIAGVVWVVMRPWVGIPMLLIFFGMLGAGIAFKARSQQARSQQQGDSLQQGHSLQQARAPFV